MNGYAFFDGKILPAAELRISPDDPGFLYGEGLFETLRSYNGQPFRCPDHIKRLQTGARLLGLPCQIAEKEIKKIILTLLTLNQLSNARIRIIISRASSNDQNQRIKPSHLYITTSPLPYYLPWKSGASAVISTIRRNPFTPLTRLKTQNYLECVLARQEAKKQKAYEAIFLDFRGFVLESSTANIFIVKQEKIFTPPLSQPLLPGITRKIVLEIASNLGIPAFEKRLKPNELISAEEIFITNSIIEILPITRIGSRIVNKGKRGEITTILQKAYKKLVSQETKI